MLFSGGVLSDVYGYFAGRKFSFFRNVLFGLCLRNKDTMRCVSTRDSMCFYL